MIPQRSFAPLVVTGTDTGVGKTRISRGVLHALRRNGTPVAPLKLIETGCVRVGEHLQPDDGVALAHAVDLFHALDLIAPERFELPAAPRTAAGRVGRTLNFASLTGHVTRAAALASRILIEGAGGLLVPLGPEGTFGDLVASLDAGLVVVARDSLGTLNHTLLTVEAARTRKLRVAAVVLNAVEPVPSTLEHARELRASLPGVPIYGPLPWAPDAGNDELADHLAMAGLDPDMLRALWN